MSSPLTDPAIIRAFILHDALLKVPFSEGYKNLQKIVGDDVVSYADYDFWYHRFYGGNLDLNYDRSADPSPPILEELPIEVLDAILGNLDVKNRFKVRKLSQTMLQVVDQLKTVYNHLRIQCYGNSLCLSISDVPRSLQYSRWADGRCRIDTGYGASKIVQGDFLEIGLRDLSILLKSPKLRIGSFIVEDQHFEAFQQVLDTLKAAQNSRIHVESAQIKVRFNQHAMALVAMLKPGALEKLEIQISKQKEFEQSVLSTVKNMEQFRQLKIADLSHFGAISAEDLPHFYGFEDFKVLVKTLTPADVLGLRESLSKPDNKTKSCTVGIQMPTNVVEIGRALGEEVKEGDWVVKHTCSIDNSQVVFNFHF